jgi:hypothetical protein
MKILVDTAFEPKLELWDRETNTYCISINGECLFRNVPRFDAECVMAFLEHDRMSFFEAISNHYDT